MKGELNKDWYCNNGHTEWYRQNYCIDKCSWLGCPAHHRKWPTPEQFKGEYGVDWDSAVYVMKYTKDLRPYWGFYDKRGSEAYSDYEFVVCACTPWGKPPNDWRPE